MSEKAVRENPTRTLLLRAPGRPFQPSDDLFNQQLTKGLHADHNPDYIATESMRAVMEDQLVTQQVDIIVGLAIVKAHGDGGWALLGGETTPDFDVALAHGTALDQVIDRCGGRPRATRAGRWPIRRF